MKAGRPSVYQDTYPDELVDLMSQGWLDVQVYAKWGICKDTFYAWLREKPELKEAYNRGFAKCEAHYINKAQSGMVDREDGGFKYFISLMNNKFGWEKGSKGDSNTTTNINIGNMNVLQQKSREDLLTYVNNMLVKHKDIIDIEPVVLEDKSDDELR